MRWGSDLACGVGGKVGEELVLLEMDYIQIREVFRNGFRMHWRTSTRGGVDSARDGIYFKRRTFHSHPRNVFCCSYEASDGGSDPFVLVA